jgi:hypothetical protein
MPKLKKTIGDRELILFSQIIKSTRNNGRPPETRVLFSKNGTPWVKNGTQQRNETSQDAEFRYFEELRTHILGKNNSPGLAEEANWLNREEIVEFFNEFQEILKSQPEA